MPAPAVLPPLPAAPGLRSAPASVPAGDASPGPFDQHLQAARSAQASDAPPSPADTPSTSNAIRPEAGGAGGASPADAAGKSAQESNMSPVATPSAASAASNASTTGASSGSTASTDASLIDAALATAQAASAVAAGTGAVAAAKPAATSKTDEPDSDAAASLAGSMLAMLGQITGTASGVADADGGKVSGDGAASGRGKAAALLQVAAQGGQASGAASAASMASLAGALGNATGMPEPAGADTHKDRALDALTLATAAAPASMPTSTAQAPVVPQLQLSSSPGSAGFAGDLGQQVVWLSQQGVQQAKVRLHPEDLGSLDVKLSVSHGRVDVVFSAQHPAAVAAVQQSLPQLDHMLAQHGLALGHAEVGQQQSQGNGHARGDGGATSAAGEAGDVQDVTSTAVVASRVGLLDAFA